MKNPNHDVSPAYLKKYYKQEKNTIKMKKIHTPNLPEMIGTYHENPIF